MTELRTDRLLLRHWQEADRDPFARLNADPIVMRYFPSVLSREESDAQAERIASTLEERGWGLWAVEVPGVADFVGFVGLAIPSFGAHFTPAIEIGWRLAGEHQGRGYATEGAREVMRHGFESLDLDEIVSFTVPANHASRRVMEKLGMRRDPADDFDHPRLVGHPLQRHVLYRLSEPVWRRALR